MPEKILYAAGTGDATGTGHVRSSDGLVGVGLAVTIDIEVTRRAEVA